MRKEVFRSLNLLTIDICDKYIYFFFIILWFVDVIKHQSDIFQMSDYPGGICVAYGGFTRLVCINYLTAFH